MKHCGEEMTFKLWQQEHPDKNNIPEVLVYEPQHRAYGYYLDKKIPVIQYISYCPFCGSKLPELLIFDYDDALEEAVGKEFCDIKEEEIPKEFQTDEWWKKRGL
jgi:hypothetical protein